MLITTKNIAKINVLKALLECEFEVNDLGVEKKILGINIRKDRRAGCYTLRKACNHSISIMKNAH